MEINLKLAKAWNALSGHGNMHDPVLYCLQLYESTHFSCKGAPITL